MQNPVFYGAFLTISRIKPKSVVTNYSECVRSNSAYRDAYVTRSQTQSLVCMWKNIQNILRATSAHTLRNHVYKLFSTGVSKIFSVEKTLSNCL